MYIWTAINIDDQLKGLKHHVQRVEKQWGFKNSTLTLPFHISLKISFEVSDTIYPNIIKTLYDYYKALEPFDIEVAGIEIENMIVWIRMKENPVLKRIHEELDQILMEKHGIMRHEYDLDFKFHTTLFLDADEKKISEAYGKIESVNLPSRLHAKELIIGESKTGEVGTYRVTHNIELERQK